MAIENLSEKVAKYAAEKTNEFLTGLVSQAFEDGYRMGYQDGEDEIPVDLRDDKTEYIDLGLPSGTLWAMDYEKKGGEIVFLPHGQASRLNIPTKEQIEELISCCRWEYDYEWSSSGKILTKAKCVGPNGNVIIFMPTGLIRTDSLSESHDVNIWGKELSEEPNGTIMNIYYKEYNIQHLIDELFTGYHLPVRLVKTK